MPVEIERKFLVKSNSWRTDSHKAIEIRQGYLCKDIERTVRVRTWDTEGKITVKGKSVDGSRAEYEYTIPLAHAIEMLENLCLPGVVHKIRHLVTIEKHLWEIDEFLDHNKGLILAEVELSSINESVDIPSWAGLEVTNDHRFQNSYLSSNIVTF